MKKNEDYLQIQTAQLSMEKSKTSFNILNQEVQTKLIEFTAAFLIATMMMLIFLEVFKGRFLFELFFSGAIIFGAQGPLRFLFSRGYAFLLATALPTIRFLLPRIWTQNLAIIIGVSGIAANFGMYTSPATSAGILILLSVYDMIAVYKTRHMSKLFKGMAEKGAVLALVIPKNFSSWKNRFDFTKPEKRQEFVFLGTGDLALPIFFAVSTLPMGSVHFYFTISGAIVGIICNHLFFILQKEKKAIPALPLISFFAIIFFIISLTT
ncbi:MAG: presenilin family intramembrane aspartyl protease [Candidatus Pacebacteria bacterium]|nr:presenilin family intramembrane aspartyl protease [Candidatus Paceibacterota bacterium]